MEKIRKPLEGVYNIIRFNWHFYLLALILAGLLVIFIPYLNDQFLVLANISLAFLILSLVVSLATSFYVYDVSDLYTLSWLDDAPKEKAINVLNINAGFDEVSVLLQKKYSNSTLIVFDFYNPAAHTEVSIKRARKAYPPHPNTKYVNTACLPLMNSSMDRIFAILSAHEIRNKEERIAFFKELDRIINTSGEIIVTEHLRDTANFLVYNIGAFHFYTKKTWLKTFSTVGLQLEKEIKITSFITTFILKKNGCSS